MAKSARKRKDKDPTATPGKAVGSALELAYLRYQAGDALEARRTARALLAASLTPADEAAAKQLATELLGPLKDASTPSAHELAKAIIERTRVPPKAYLFAGVTSLAFLGMVLLALTRS